MDEARAREILAAAGVPVAEARLLALGENAVFAVGDLAVKVGRDAELFERAERELALAAWLADAEVPAVRAAEEKPRLVEGHPLTFWHRLPEAVRPAEPRDLAPLLRRIHALPEPGAFTLPRRELLGGVE
ncbi:phosphotransferase, partial [Streptomyces sp. NPDC057674]|uniref:phosphotransferase n=1 Tax=Streptomyces sp. NPDC057674 TaxID=3346203 RepID=UPI003677FCB0